jgi:hypothetical protein
MTKKIVLGIVLFGLIGILVAGAVVRTAAKAGDSAEAHGGYGRNGENQELAGTPRSDSDVEGLAGRGGYGDGTGTGQSAVDEWLTLEGSVVSADTDTLVVQTTDGEQVVVENRPWWFAQEQGFTAQSGDQVTLTAFYEADSVEVGSITDVTSGQSVQLRDQSGRPMWAGRGRRNG